MKRPILFAVSILACAASLSSAHAEDSTAADYQKMFDQWAVQIAEIQKTESSSAVAREVEMVRSLIGQGQAFVASEKFEEIGPIAERASVLIRYAQAKAVRVDTERRAAEAEEAAKAAQLAAERAQAEADAIAAKYSALEKQGL